MAENTCSLCGVHLGANRSNKVNLHGKLKRQTETAQDVLHDHLGLTFTPDRSAYTCYACSTVISKISAGKRIWSEAIQDLKSSSKRDRYVGQKVLATAPSTPQKSKRRKIVTSTPIKKNVKVTINKKMKHISYAASLIKKSRHATALHLLLQKSKTFKMALLKVVGDIIKKEMKAVCHPAFKSVWRASGDPYLQISSFNWQKVLAESEEKCPVLLSLLKAAGSKSRTEKSFAHGIHWLAPNIGAIIGQIVFMRNHGHMKLLQQMVGVEMWLAGCSREAFATLNHLGLCLSKHAVRRCIDMICRQYADDLLQQKSLLTDRAPQARRRLFDNDEPFSEEVGMRMLDETGSTDMYYTLEQDSLSESNDDQVSSTNLMEDTINYGFSDTDDDEITMVPMGYTLVFDNVNQKTRARYSTREHGNQMLNMVQAYAAIDRVPCMGLSDYPPSPMDIMHIPVESFYPDHADYQLLRYEFIILVQRILVQEEPFKCLQDRVQAHIPHKYSKELGQKSKVIPLGVLAKDETKIADMVDIMVEYQQYVPGRLDSDPVSCILYGDALSCERANDAQIARINGGSKWDRLQGLVPAIQEWHKRGILLEDTFKLLYRPQSARDVGTLYYIRNRYRHHNVNSKTSSCFNYATDLLRFATEAYVIASSRSMIDKDHIPKDIEKLWCYFQSIAKKVATLGFHPPELQDCNADSSYCGLCQLESDTEEFICCDNYTCPKGRWFHLTCLGLSDNDVPAGEWFCSGQCEVMSTKCNKDYNSKQDHVFEYSKALLWRGLGEMARHDAIREGDGDRIISHWRHDMIEFFDQHHPKYFVCGYNLLSALNGGVSSRLAHKLRWNRTVNTAGKEGHNIEMDLQMEFFNREYKEAVKTASGNLTDDTIARHSQMVGIKKTLQYVFDHKILNRGNFKRSKGVVRRNADIEDLVKILLDNKCCEFISGRYHSAFPDIHSVSTFNQMEEFKKRIQKHLKKMSKRLEIIVD